MDDFIGFVELDGTLTIPLLTRTPTTLVPINPDAAPTYQVYDADGTTANILATGSMSKRHTGNVSTVTNGTQYKITSTASHGLKTGHLVTLAGITGSGNMTADCAGTKRITSVDATNFTLDGTTFSGAYSTGGTYNVTGWYYSTLSVSSGTFVRGKTYTILVGYAVGAVAMSHVLKFTVT